MNEREKIQNEAIEALEKNNFNGIVVLPTGTGKSRVMIEAMRKLRDKLGDIRILYLCNSTNLRDVVMKEELKKWGEPASEIEFMCYQTAYKLENNSFDLLLGDEFDFSLSDKYKNVYLNNEFHHKILVSATIEDDRREIAEKIAPIVYEKKLQEIEQKGVLNKSNYYFVNYKLTDDENIKYLKLNKDCHELLLAKQSIESSLNIEIDEKKARSLKGSFHLCKYKLEMLQYERKRMLNSLKSSSDCCKRLMADIYKRDRECRIVVFSELTSQADAVCKYSYHGKNEGEDNLNKFKNEEIQALSVCGKINRGENIKGINNIIIESCNSSKTQLIQRLGRGKRLQQHEILDVYFLIPYYMKGKILTPTKTLDWMESAAKDLDLRNIKQYEFR